MAELEYEDVGSPSAAMIERQSLEQRIVRLETVALSQFLSAVRRAANEDAFAVTPPRVNELWALSQPDYSRLGADLEAELEEEWAADETPDLTYSAVREVASAAATEGWSASTLAATLAEVLDPSIGLPVRQEATAITASADKITISEGLMSAGLTWLARRQRAARLSATGLASAARQARIRVNGVEKKRWVTRHDDRVRSTHEEMDGVTIGTEESFIVGGTAMRYPGDKQGEFGERVNCRCVLVGVVPRGWRGRAD